MKWVNIETPRWGQTGYLRKEINMMITSNVTDSGLNTYLLVTYYIISREHVYLLSRTFCFMNNLNVVCFSWHLCVDWSLISCSHAPSWVHITVVSWKEGGPSHVRGVWVFCREGSIDHLGPKIIQPTKLWKHI